MIQEARIALPPTKGANLNTAATVLPGTAEESDATCHWTVQVPGSDDQGPVHSTTTTTSTAKGIQAWRISAVRNPWALVFA